MPKSLISVAMFVGFTFCAAYQMTTDHYARHYRDSRVQSVAERAGVVDQRPRLGDTRIRDWLDEHDAVAVNVPATDLDLALNADRTGIDEPD